MVDDQSFPKIAEKWGFGMAPPKSLTQQDRIKAAERLVRLIAELKLPQNDERSLADISTIKGLFSRIAREDQWDWFTVARQLGYPSRRISKIIATEMANLCTAIKTQDKEKYLNARSNLTRLPFFRCLSVFIGSSNIIDEPNAGWIYILSTREFRDLLKIGMTKRTVEQRVHEINRATGVAIPFGVRRCWRVSDPEKAEKLVHCCLAEFRLRNDREFFRIDFDLAARMINEAINTRGLQIRTLDALAALTP